MTEAQKAALDACHEKLGEHFEAFVIVTVDNESGHADAHVSHGGGFHAALGLLADAHHSYMHRQFDDEQ